MTIRYTCENCGSTLKIKDDLAGKPGKCPKCRTKFTIPEASAESAEAPQESDAPASDESDEAPSALAAPMATENDDFDVDTFLLSDPGTPTGNSKSKAAPARAAVRSTADAEASLLDESDDRRPSKGQPTSVDDDDDSFQIRRGEPRDSPARIARAAESDDDVEAPRAAKRPPGTNANINAANFAQDLLAKSGKKGKKVWTEVDPDAGGEPGYDWVEIRRLALTKGLPAVVGAICLVWILYSVVGSALVTKRYMPELGKVTGTVTLQGKPLIGAEVSFYPIRSEEEKQDKKKRAGTSIGITDEQGKYELNYEPGTKGAAVGPCRVTIEEATHAVQLKKYSGPRSELKKVVTAGRQVIDFDL